MRIQPISPSFELFEEDVNGDSNFILDNSIKLSKRTFEREKEYKDYLGMMDTVGKTVYGTQQPVYAYIRDHYFGNGVILKPRIWAVDIESIFQGKYDAEHKIKIRKKNGI